MIPCRGALRLLPLVTCLLGGAVLRAEPASAQPGAAPAALPATPAGRLVPEFLSVLNGGDFAALWEFAAARYDTAFLRRQGGAEAAAAYWLNVHRQYGPLVVHAVDAGSAPEWYWFRSTANRALIGIQFHLTEGPPHRITRHPLDRGGNPPGRPVPPRLAPAELSAYLDAYLDGAAEAGVFSGVVLLAHHGMPLFQGAYGQADRRHGVANHLDTRFHVASVGKVFTAVAIGQLLQQGRLSLDDRIDRFIPEYPRHIGGRATIRHLLTHTSGIELDTIAEFEAAVREAGSVEELLRAQLRFARFLPDSAGYAPLARMDYTNEGVDLLGVIVERVSGKAYDRYLRDHVFHPAGMLHSGVEYLAPVPHLARGYTPRADLDGTLVRGPLVENVRWLAARARPSGNHYTTAGDLLLFANALLGHRLLDAETTRLLTAPAIEIAQDGTSRWAYGMGFEVVEQDGIPSIGHSGSFAGVSADFRMYPSLGVTLIVLSNYEFAAFPVADHVQEVLRKAFAPD
ncbi:MAG TPA: serine hydrolase domain-containing protein [Longimicrobium sp.]|nr:serine hydrolase domain-containing protein [Longimicrobium sp.]